ncbi:MAG: MATE family efflux transporter [Solobacterium sp.]|nr:MATE family efflux transporter [Solobacterium sp.]
MNQKKKGGGVDLLHGPILKALILFMIPVMISNIFQQLYNAVDTAIVGNYLGENSLAAIGACASIFDMMVGFCNSLGQGFSIVCGRSFGSGDAERMKKSVAGAIKIGLATCVVLTLLSIVGLKPLLELINTPAEIINESLAYIRVIGLGLVVMFTYNMCSAMLRAIGNSIMPLVFLIISSLLNIVLDIMFITVFHWGVVGAAVATVIAQGVSVVLCLIYIYNYTKVLVPQPQHFRHESALMKDLAGQGYSMAVMGSIVSVGSIILQSGINSLGTEIIAGHVAARKIYMLCNLPFMSMGIAISAFIAQNRGANQGQRILKAMRSAYMYDFIMAAVITAILWVSAPTLVRLITGSENPVIIGNGTKYLRIVGPFYAVLGVLMQTRFALQGVGSKIMPLFSSIIEFIGKILFVVLLIPRFQYDAVVWCEPIIWCFMTVYLLYAFFTNPYIRSIER